MDLSYLGQEIITDENLDLRENAYFKEATMDAKGRNKNHPDRLNDRFNRITTPKALFLLQEGFKIFQKHQKCEALLPS